jgi:tetratricopeptide (TPR) repeat protein
MSRCLCQALLAALLTFPGLAQTASEKQPAPVSATNSIDLLKDASHLLRTGRFDAAVEDYQQVLQVHPEYPAVYAGLTRAYLKLGKVEEAYQTISRGIKAAETPALHVALGEVYFRQGRIVDAEKEWAAVVNAGNLEPRAFLGLARVRRAIAMYHSSKTFIDRAYALDPEDPDIQKFWIQTLTRQEQIANLERYLGGENAESPEKREETQLYLDYLKARQKEPTRYCHLQTQITSTETPLVMQLQDVQHIREYALAVVLNGHKSNLMLDTGASGLLVDRRVAEKAGIVKLVDSQVRGIGDKGSTGSYLGYAESVKIGELEFRDCVVEVLEKRSVLGDDGLIGADVFEDFLVDIDFPDRKLKLAPLPQPPDVPAPRLSLQTDDPSSDSEQASGKSGNDQTKNLSFHDRYIAPEMKSYSPVFRFHHDLLVPTRIGDTTPKLFLLDTGAFNNAISEAAAREVTKVHGDSNTIIKGLSGSVKKVYSADNLTLQFGRLRQENQDMVAWDLTGLSEQTGTEVSGFLGFAMLQLLDLKIDYRDALVDFEYHPKR